MEAVGVNCSVVRPDSVSADLDQLADSTSGLKFNQRDGTWGSDLSKNLGEMVGADARDKVYRAGIPLSEFEQFEGCFEEKDTINIEVIQNGISTPVTINASDTIETLSTKLSEATGGATTVDFKDDENGERMVSLTTDLTEWSRIFLKGDREFLNILGMRSNLEHKFSLDASKVVNQDIHFRSFYLNSENGKVYDSDIVITSDRDKELNEWGLYADFEAAYLGQIPKHDVKLRDINQFWKSQDVFMLDQPQKITVTQGDGKSAGITLYESDTIEDIRRKLNDAIANDLGQSSYVDR